MAGPDSRRQRNLMILLGLLVAFFVLRQVAPMLGGGGGESFLGGSRAVDFTGAIETPVAALELERMDAQAQAFEGGRNPWQFGQAPRPAPPPPRPRPESRPEPVEKTPEPEVDPTPPKPQPPPVDVEFLGSFGPDARRIAVFEKDELVINALEGDVIEEKFRVHAIGLESVDLTFEGFPDVPPERLAIKGTGR